MSPTLTSSTTISATITSPTITQAETLKGQGWLGAVDHLARAPVARHLGKVRGAEGGGDVGGGEDGGGAAAHCPGYDMVCGRV